MTDTPRTPTDEGAREESAEAAHHRGEAREERREAVHDRREADDDRAEGDRLESAGNRVEAAGHEVAARGRDAAARHDEREAAEERHAGSRTAPSAAGTQAATAGGAHDDREGHPPAARTEVGSGAVAEAAGPSSNATADTAGSALLPDEQRRRLRARWDEIQAGFIDNPRESVAHADSLVSDATTALHNLFERERHQLEGAWDRGDDVSTEDLRVTLQRYRSFFERLLSL